MRIKNKHIYSKDIEWLKTIRQEYTEIGFDTALRGNILTVFSRKKPRKRKKKKSDDKSR